MLAGLATRCRLFVSARGQMTASTVAGLYDTVMAGEGPASTSLARAPLQDVDTGPSPGMTWRASASLEVIRLFPRES
jgi:hypothetical protein